jgi:hypothetical protein
MTRETDSADPADVRAVRRSGIMEETTGSIMYAWAQCKVPIKGNFETINISKTLVWNQDVDEDMFSNAIHAKERQGKKRGICTRL